MRSPPGSPAARRASRSRCGAVSIARLEIASSAVRRRSRRTRRSSQSTVRAGRWIAGRRWVEERPVAAVPSPAAAARSSISSPDVAVAASGTLEASAPAGCPSGERAGDQRRLAVGVRTTIAISSGSTPSASSRAILRPISSASPRLAGRTRAGHDRRRARSARSRARRGCARGGGGSRRVGPRRRSRSRSPSRRARRGGRAEQLGPRGERLPVLEGDRDHDLGRGGERADQLDLFRVRSSKP